MDGEDLMILAVTSWLSSPVFTLWGAPTSWSEVLGFVTGAVCVYLVAKQHIFNWPVGIANNVLWILLFATVGLYADAGLQVVYILLALWGWYTWLHGGANRTVLPVSSLTRKESLWLASVLVSGTAGVTLFLDHLTSSTVPFWDAVTTVLSLLATYGQVKKKWESWLLWIAADAIYIPLYQHKGLTLTAILYVGFAALCVKGLLAWRASMRAPVGSASTSGSVQSAASAELVDVP